MSKAPKTVDGFLFMPPALRAYISKDIPDQPFSGRIPWTPLDKPISETTFTLLTSAGISMKSDPPFDMEGEKAEPLWGDPSYRRIPKTATENDIEVNHLHVNTDFIKQDINVMLPLARFREFECQRTRPDISPAVHLARGAQKHRLAAPGNIAHSETEPG